MSGPFASLNGFRIARASVLVPYYGIWTADVQLDSAQALAGAVSLVLGNLTLQGSVYRADSFAGVTYARLVGGAGGWMKEVPSATYDNPVGVRLATVLYDVATLVGEKVNIVADSLIGLAYVREKAPAQRVLRQLAGAVWFIDPKGVTQISSRVATKITSQFTVIERDAGRGLLDIATEDYASWMPANTFSSPLVPATQTISATRFDMDNGGELRLKVLVT